MKFYKFRNNQTVFDSELNVYTIPKAAFKAGVKKDWSNLKILDIDLPFKAFFKYFTIIN